MSIAILLTAAQLRKIALKGFLEKNDLEDHYKSRRS